MIMNLRGLRNTLMRLDKTPKLSCSDAFLFKISESDNHKELDSELNKLGLEMKFKYEKEWDRGRGIVYYTFVKHG